MKQNDDVSIADIGMKIISVQSRDDRLIQIIDYGRVIGIFYKTITKRVPIFVTVRDVWPQATRIKTAIAEAEMWVREGKTDEIE